MVNCTAAQNYLAAQYAGLGSWIGVASTSPGTSSTPTGEASGGSPAYARLGTTWSAGTTGVQNGTAVTLNLSAATYTYMLIASASSGNNMQDNASIAAVTLGSQGQLVITPTFTQT
jgi:hypothetical protein